MIRRRATLIARVSRVWMRPPTTVSEPYVEAVVLLSRKADPDATRSWFVARGFVVSQMAGANLQIAGSGDLFTQVFRKTEAQIARRRTQDVDLPIPGDLLDSVESIVIRRLPSLHV